MADTTDVRCAVQHIEANAGCPGELDWLRHWLREAGQTVDKLEAAANLEARLRQPEVIEALAAYAHVSWTNWMEWQQRMRYETHPSGESFLDRWQRQMRTPYIDLSESEKASDRREAEAIIATLLAVLGHSPTKEEPRG